MPRPAPAFFTYGTTNYAVASRLPDYAMVGDPSAVPGTVAARPGDILVLWGTGFGTTNPALPAGQVDNQPAAVLAATTATIGGVAVPVISAVLSGGYAGLDQVNLQVPANLPAGALGVQVTVGGVQSPPTMIFVGQ